MIDLSAAITVLYTHGILTGRERDMARRRLAQRLEAKPASPLGNAETLNPSPESEA